MPVSHSHQLLCVPVRLSTTVVSLLGFAGSVTSQISCALPPSGRSRYHLPLTPRGSVLPLQTRTICAPPVRRSSPVGNVREVFGLRRVGHVDDRRPAHLQLAGQRIHERLLVVVVTDVGDLPAVLIDDERLVGGSSLEVVMANELPCSTGDGRSLGPGAGAAAGGGDPPPVNATGGIAGPFGTSCVCAMGVATSSAASRHDASNGRLRFRVRMASPCFRIRTGIPRRTASTATSAGCPEPGRSSGRMTGLRRTGAIPCSGLNSAH